jgi:SAM-dependent methyltransferase
VNESPAAAGAVPYAAPVDQGRIWRYFQNEGIESFADATPRLRFLARQFDAGEMVLNVGVGNGAFEALATLNGVLVHSADPDVQSIERIRTTLGVGERAKVAYIESLPWPDDTFDGVVASEVFEHLDDGAFAQGLREIKRVLKRGGRLVCTTPADEDLIASTVVCPHCGMGFHRWGHQRSFSMASLGGALQAAGFSIEVSQQRAFVAWRNRNWKGRTEAFVRVLLHRLGVHGANENLFIAARKP